MTEFYVTAAPGTEEALRDELCECHFRSVRLNHGGIPFQGEWEDGWRACLQTRVGQRVMAVLSRSRATTLTDIYFAAKEIDWTEFLTPRLTFAVAAYSHPSTGVSPNQVALKTKDAIADFFREGQGSRPNVNKEDPDLRVFVYFAREKVTFYVDLSGEPLFKRGYRIHGGEAPLKETLASAIIRLSGWDGSTPLVDPMCGSGTIVIEAALRAAKIAPGIWRNFGFQRWANYTEESKERFRALTGELRRQATGQPPRITGFDISEEALEAAHQNAQSAGLRLSFRKMAIRELQADGTRRFLITNPPYGIRLDADNQIYQELRAAVLRLKGWRVCFLTGNPKLVRSIPVRPAAEYPLKNGDIDCHFVCYEC